MTFETQTHSVVTSRNKYKLYNTAGLHSDVSSLKPREVLGNLYRFIRAFDGGIHLLIYVVDEKYKHSVNNVKLFYDFLCRRDVPIILVTSSPQVPSASRSEINSLPHFKDVLVLNGDNPESDRTNLREALSTYIKRDPKEILPMDRFQTTTSKSWKLLERAAGWSMPQYQDAIKGTLIDEAFFSEQDAAVRAQYIADYIKKHYFRNVIIFGDTGAGKTSVVRMLSDKVEVDPSKGSSAGGSTFESKAYEIDIDGYHYVFHDTVGLDDATSTSLSPEQALTALYQLSVKVEGGISLLVYVHRGKISPSQVENYRLFSRIICQSKVPTVLVVTGLEEVDSRDEWWEANKELFNAQGMGIEHHVCITSTKGVFNKKRREYVYQDIFDESKKALETVVLEAPLETPWKVDKSPHYWRSIVVQVYNMFATKLKWGPLGANIFSVLGIQEDYESCKMT
jgi:hypothetical protein